MSQIALLRSIEPDLTVAGTGHRPDKILIGRRDGFHPDVDARVVELAAAALRRVRPARVISGMALGWDTALAEAAVALGIPFLAYIPFRGQEKKWLPESRERYFRLLGQAEYIVTCSDGGYSRHAMQVRNVRMVNDSALLLALWNGSAGGTANCLRYATEVRRPAVNLWPVWLRHTGQQLAA